MAIAKRTTLAMLLGALVAGALIVGTLVGAKIEMTSSNLASVPATVGPRFQAASRGGFQTLDEPSTTTTDDLGLISDAPLLALTQAPQPTAGPLSVAAIAAEPVTATPPPATPRPPAAPIVAPMTTSSSAAELRTLALMNTSRAQAGVGPLTLDTRVSVTARAHSAAESQVGYVYHDGADGTAQSRDAAACGTGWYGENTGKVWNGNVDALHYEFMAEPLIPINHHTNIVDPNFKRVGIGAVRGSDALYLTMMFCR